MKPRNSPKTATPSTQTLASRSPKRKTRLRFSIREKLDLLRQFEAEGLTVAAFCKARGLKNNVYKWLEAYRRHGAKAFRNGRAPKSARPKYQTRRYALTEGARPEPDGPLSRRLFAALARAGQRGLTARALANKVGRDVSQIWNWLYKAERQHPTLCRIEGPRLRESQAPLKAGLIRALAEAGRPGCRLIELANQFGETGLRVGAVIIGLCRAGLVEKAARGRYRLRRRAGTPASLVRKTCGTTRTLVLAALKAAGPAGASVKTLAAKLGLTNWKLGLTNWKLGNWFATAGKTEPSIERLARGVYRLRPASLPKPTRPKIGRKAD